MYSLKDIVDKFIGPLKIYGETYGDEKTLDNLDIFKNLLEDMMGDLWELSNNTQGRSEESAKEIHEKVLEIKHNIQECLNDIK